MGARPPVHAVRSCSGCTVKAMAKGGAATVLAVLAAATLLCLRDPAAAALPRLEHPAKNDGSPSLLVVGDWGRKGECNQYQVAEQMGRVGEKLDIDFVVSTGDNFYDTVLTGVDDDAFEQSFMDIYTENSLHKPWYLGDMLPIIMNCFRVIEAYCIVATESAGRQIPMVFLEMIKEDFNNRYAGGKAATATANSLTRDFGLRLRDQMQYCTDHPEDVSKLSKVKAQVEQVKSIMMENIDKAHPTIAWTISCLLAAEKILVERWHTPC